MTERRTQAQLAEAPPNGPTHPATVDRITTNMRATAAVLDTADVQSMAADGQWKAVDRDPVRRLLDQLDMEAAVGCGWWETDTTGLVLGFVSAGPSAAVFTAIAQVLREGHDPDVVVGGTSADAAFAVALEWLEAGIEADHVAGWLRTGCWKPVAARALTDAGLRPWRLLDDHGQPLHWINVPTPHGEQMPVARAVAEEFVVVETAVRIVVGQSP
jgi:hypothetical protein